MENISCKSRPSGRGQPSDQKAPKTKPRDDDAIKKDKCDIRHAEPNSSGSPVNFRVDGHFVCLSLRDRSNSRTKCRLGPQEQTLPSLIDAVRVPTMRWT